MCMIDVDESPELWSESEVKARKNHRCDTCLTQIAKGDKYLKHFSIFQGDQSDAKMCWQCYQDRKDFAAAHGGVLAHPDGFIEMLNDCIYEGDDDSDKNWRPMRDRILDARKAQAGKD